MENFIDYVKIFCKSGKGGPGASHFHREKFVPKGGPDGGDGGRGGHVILRGNAQLWTLLHLKYQKHIIADDGHKGEGALSSGKDGKSKIIEVPVGTVVRDFETGVIDAEINADGEEYILMAGGKGGLGNHHFRTSTRQAPTYSQPGLFGQEAWKVLELKLLADVGLVGFPNAGKSTLISAVSNARPEIAAYPFTTLTPNLGMVEYKGGRSFVMADIPGIIEGASEGKGLGLRFLRHIERNSILLFMVPIDSNSLARDYHILLSELGKYNPELLTKDRMLAITKCDLANEELITLTEKELKKDLKKELKPANGPAMPLVFISAATGLGIETLKNEIMKVLDRKSNI